MLLAVDKAFLREFVSLPYMGKPVSAIGLYRAGCECDDTAMLVHKHVLLLDEEKATEKAKKEGDSARVQIVVIARLLAEFVGGLEDLGALCFAIKHRNKQSIFKRYVLSETEHGQFHRFIVDSIDEGIQLSEMINIPHLDDLKQQFARDPNKYNGFAQLYQQSAIQIIEAARRYKSLGITAIDVPNPKDYAYVICDAMDTSKSPKSETRGVLVRAYNKIKHRFLVFEDRESLMQEMKQQEIGLEIGWYMLSRKPEDVWNLYKMTMGVSQCLFTIAGLLIILEDNGVDL
ncbi:hypothetical protein P22_2521 [Propionispora sp. 2/2-37]|uniref:hypothetical protein n=1 Tax=Propionispora sp. 2/2-37 TaxID=1677858 RepID=UPI0006BB58C7|nr:hypothetical protein [Propionispora sp. 2/2-37]CUH96431.1 hypothetical protein P22_2521 [Propionispora sp. 2/2-37]